MFNTTARRRLKILTSLPGYLAGKKVISDTLYHFQITSTRLADFDYDFQAEISIETDKTLAFNGFIFDRICWISEPILERNLDSNIDEWEQIFRSTQQPFIESL